MLRIFQSIFFNHREHSLNKTKVFWNLASPFIWQNRNKDNPCIIGGDKVSRGLLNMTFETDFFLHNQNVKKIYEDLTESVPSKSFPRSEILFWNMKTTPANEVIHHFKKQIWVFNRSKTNWDIQAINKSCQNLKRISRCNSFYGSSTNGVDSGCLIRVLRTGSCEDSSISTLPGWLKTSRLC